MEKEIDQCYKNDAKRIVDTLFESGVFHEKITRDDMNAFENLIAFYLDSNAKSVKRDLEFIETVKHLG